MTTSPIRVAAPVAPPAARQAAGAAGAAPTPLPAAAKPTAGAARAMPLAASQAAAGYDHIFDFPGFAAGDRFRLEKGSTANGWGIKGEGLLRELTPTSAAVWVKGGKFGFYKEADVELRQTSPTTAHMVATEKGGEPYPVDMDISDVRTGYTRFTPTSIAADPATIQVNEAGQIVMDVHNARDGLRFHLVMAKDKG